MVMARHWKPATCYGMARRRFRMDDFRQMLAQLRQSVVSAPLCSNCGEMRYRGSCAESTAQPEPHLTESSDDAVEELARSQPPRGREGSLCAGFLQVEE